MSTQRGTKTLLTLTTGFCSCMKNDSKIRKSILLLVDPMMLKLSKKVGLLHVSVCQK